MDPSHFAPADNTAPVQLLSSLAGHLLTSRMDPSERMNPGATFMRSLLKSSVQDILGRLPAEDLTLCASSHFALLLILGE